VHRTGADRCDSTRHRQFPLLRQVGDKSQTATTLIRTRCIRARSSNFFFFFHPSPPAQEGRTPLAHLSHRPANQTNSEKVHVNPKQDAARAHNTPIHRRYQTNSLSRCVAREHGEPLGDRAGLATRSLLLHRQITKHTVY
jgi:hypothetical protein